MLDFRKKPSRAHARIFCDYNDYIRLYIENQWFARLQFVVM